MNGSLLNLSLSFALRFTKTKFDQPVDKFLRAKKTAAWTELGRGSVWSLRRKLNFRFADIGRKSLFLKLCLKISLRLSRRVVTVKISGNSARQGFLNFEWMTFSGFHRRLERFHLGWG